MKVESRTILGAFTVLVIMAAFYWWLETGWGHRSEASGTTMLVFAFSAYLMFGLYLTFQYWRRHKVPRPEDRFDATQEDGAGVIDYFPVASVWPAGLGLGATLMAVGGIYGIWYAYIGGVLALGSIMGWVFESDHTLDVLPGSDPAEVEAGHDIPSGATRPHMDEDLAHLRHRDH